MTQKEYLSRKRPIHAIGGIGCEDSLQLLKDGLSKELEDFFFESNKHIDLLDYTRSIPGIVFEKVFAKEFKELYPNEIYIAKKSKELVFRLNFDVDRFLEIAPSERLISMVEGFLNQISEMAPIKDFDNVGFANALRDFLVSYNTSIAA